MYINLLNYIKVQSGVYQPPKLYKRSRVMYINLLNYIKVQGDVYQPPKLYKGPEWCIPTS